MKTHLLYTKDKVRARNEIRQVKGQISQEFTDELIVAQLPDEFNVSALQSSTSTIPAKLNKKSQLALGAWAASIEKSSYKELAPNKNQGLSWDTPGYQTPKSLATLTFPAQEGTQVSRSTGTPTSLYMTGQVAVGIVIVSGENNLRFSDGEIQKLIAEVQEGLQFLATTEPRAMLSFHYDIHIIHVDVEEGDTSTYDSAENPWRNEALSQMGYSPDHQGSISYVNHLKQSMGTEWAYVAYFTKYPLHHFAYAVDERLVMSYFNDGWGPDSINQVFAHETCHIFGAADEYGQCNCKSIHGYLGIPNRNCRRCATNFVPCLMERNDLALCEWTRKQIGWDVTLFP